MAHDKLKAYINGLSTDDQYFFARRCGTTIGYLRKAISVGGRIGPEIVLALERESHGALKADELRPDLNWDYLRAQAATRRRKSA